MNISNASERKKNAEGTLNYIVPTSWNDDLWFVLWGLLSDDWTAVCLQEDLASLGELLLLSLFCCRLSRRICIIVFIFPHGDFGDFLAPKISEVRMTNRFQTTKHIRKYSLFLKRHNHFSYIKMIIKKIFWCFLNV